MTDDHDHKSDNHLIGPGVVLQDTWEIIAPIGKGSFSEIFLAQDITRLDQSNRHVAVKVEEKGFDVLKWESQVLRHLCDCSVPKFYANDVYQGQNYLIMELLTGEDMANMRNRIRSRNPTGLIPLPIAAYLARQMVYCLQQMHRKGYVHRDVKPSNFVRKTKTSSEFLTIDFGLAKQYRDKDGHIRPCRERAEFRGTTIYASPFVHEQQDQCPRDDIISVMHVFLDMTCGKLPWGDAARAKDKPKVVELKKKSFDNLDDFMAWEANLSRTIENIKDVKEENFPELAQGKCKEILTHLKALGYEDEPNYGKIEMLLYESVPESMSNNVSELDYRHPFFSWSEYTPSSTASLVESDGGNKARQSLGFGLQLPSLQHNGGAGAANDTLAYTIRNLLARVSKAQDLDPYAKAGNQPTPSKDFQKQMSTAAIRWKSLMKDLAALPEDRISKDLVDRYAEILRRHKNFYDMNIENWNDFIELQLSVTQFYGLQKRIHEHAVVSNASGEGRSSTVAHVEVADIIADEAELNNGNTNADVFLSHTESRSNVELSQLGKRLRENAEEESELESEHEA